MKRRILSLRLLWHLLLLPPFMCRALEASTDLDAAAVGALSGRRPEALVRREAPQSSGGAGRRPELDGAAVIEAEARQLDESSLLERWRVPTWLHVMSPNGQKSKGGDYKIAGIANGLPFWEKASADESQFLYSMTNGKWGIGGDSVKTSNFSSDVAGVFCPDEHKGTLPSEQKCDWMRLTNDGWVKDLNVIVSEGRGDEPNAPNITLETSQPAPDTGSTKNIALKSAHVKTFNLEAAGTAASAASRAVNLHGMAASGIEATTTSTIVTTTVSAAGDPNEEESAAEPKSAAPPERSNATIQPTSATVTVTAPLPRPAIGPVPGRRNVSEEDPNRFRNGTASLDLSRVPHALRVVAPGDLTAKEGFYELFGKANGNPIWKKRDGEEWIYSMTNGRWGIGGAQVLQVQFDTDLAGIFCPQQHYGLLPQDLQCTWQRRAGEDWIEDPTIQVLTMNAATTTPGPRPGTTEGPKPLPYKRDTGL